MQVHAEVKQKADDRQAALAHRLALQYTILQEPALHNVRYSHALKARLFLPYPGHSVTCSLKAILTMRQSSAQAPLLLQEFTSLAILAYECGYDECTVKEEMSTSPLEVRPDCPLWTSGSAFSGIA